MAGIQKAPKTDAAIEIKHTADRRWSVRSAKSRGFEVARTSRWRRNHNNRWWFETRLASPINVGNSRRSAPYLHASSSCGSTENANFIALRPSIDIFSK